MDVPCPSCGALIPSEELVTELDGPPLCKSCAAIEMVRQGPRKSSSSTSRRSSASDGSYVKGFLLGFTCCPAWLGLFLPNVGSRTKMGMLIGIITNTCISFAIEAYRKSQGLPSLYGTY